MKQGMVAAGRWARRGPGLGGILAAACGLWLLGTGEVGATPSVIVEEADPAIQGVEVLALLEAGESVYVPPDAQLVLGYLDSCIRETIKGGLVFIGKEASSVTGGTVERSPARCPGAGRSRGSEAMVMAGIAVRGTQPTATPPAGSGVQSGQAPLLLEHRSPLILADGKGESVEIVEERDPKRRHRLDLAKGRVDLVTAGVQLEPGTIYVLRHGGREMRVEVARGATSGNGPALSRLVRF